MNIPVGIMSGRFISPEKYGIGVSSEALHVTEGGG